MRMTDLSLLAFEEELRHGVPGAVADAAADAMEA
jgi:hypothetical protein